MPRKSRTSRHKHGGTISASAIRYRGGFTAPEDRGKPETFRLSYLTALVTTSIANVATWNVVFDTSSVNSTSRWAGLKAIYQEWRPIGLKLTFFPNAKNAFVSSNSATAGYDQTDSMGPLFLCPYKGSATAITSNLNAVEHQVRHVNSSNQTQSAAVRMDEADEASWVSTSGTTPGAVMGVKTFLVFTTQGATDITALGNFIVDIMVQFRYPVATSLQSVLSSEEEKGSAGSPAGVVDAPSSRSASDLSHESWTTVRGDATPSRAAARSAGAGGMFPPLARASGPPR